MWCLRYARRASFLRYKNPGYADETLWFPLCDKGPDSCDWYTYGSSQCIASSPALPVFTAHTALLNSNCQMRSPHAGPFYYQLFHCPRNLPVSVFLLPKSGTTSGLNWLLQHEDVWPTFLLAAANMRRRPQDMMGWLSEEAAWWAADEESARSSVANRVMHRWPARTEDQLHADFRLFLPPAHLCPLCCAHGTGRLKDAHPVEQKNETASAGGRSHYYHCVDFTFEFDASDIFHTRPLIDMLLDERFAEVFDARKELLSENHFILHLETLKHDLPRLYDRVCELYGRFCAEEEKGNSASVTRLFVPDDNGEQMEVTSDYVGDYRADFTQQNGGAADPAVALPEDRSEELASVRARQEDYLSSALNARKEFPKIYPTTNARPRGPNACDFDAKTLTFSPDCQTSWGQLWRQDPDLVGMVAENFALEFALFGYETTPESVLPIKGHVVDTEMVLKFSSIFVTTLSELVEKGDEGDDKAFIAFASTLSSADRKYVHRIAEGFGLFTLSEGQGPTRHIRVYVSDPTGGLQEAKGRGRKGKGKGKAGELSLKGPQEQALADCARLAVAFDRPVPKANVVSTVTNRKKGPQRGGNSNNPEDLVHIAMDVGSVEAACELHALGERRKELPAWAQREEVLESVQMNQVTLISGETGCGKSTQVPQFLLDGNDCANILVAQPRKIAAISLANRVQQERGDHHAKKQVGFHVPLERRRTQGTRLTFCTTAMLRRRLFTDPELSGVTHIVFDEVHERDKLADFALIFIRDLVRRRPDLRLLLMSATLQLETFENYFEGIVRKVHIPGRTFPVKELYLDQIVPTLWKVPGFRRWLGPGILSAGIEMEDEKEWKRTVFQREGRGGDGYWGLADHIRPLLKQEKFSKGKLTDGLAKMDVLQQSSLDFDFPIIEALIMWIDKNYKDVLNAQLEEHKDNAEEQEKLKRKPLGAVLVFLTGWNDIDKCQRILESDLDEKKFQVMPLHGQVSMEQQQECFKPMEEQGVRKIVLTTNIAEASITVPDVEFVIDCGRAKETSYDPYLKVATLTTSWISQASVAQRAGRAGRTQGGLCFHLFSKKRRDEGMDAFTEPELLRTPLEESCLAAKMLLLETEQEDTKIHSFLLKAPTPPEKLGVDNAVELLKSIGALEAATEALTPLGKALCNSSLPPTLAKTVMWSALFGVLDDVLQVVGSTAFCRDPFITLGKKLHDSDGKNSSGKGKSTSRDPVTGETTLEMTTLQDTNAASGSHKTRIAAPFVSDHIGLLRALQQSKQGTDLMFIQNNGLNSKTMRQMSDSGLKLRADLPDQGLGDGDGYASRNCGQEHLILSVLTAGLYPNVAVKRCGRNTREMEVKGGKVSAAAHASTCYGTSRGLGDVISQDEWCVFEELTQVESSYSMKNISLVHPLVLCLMAGEERMEDGELKMYDGWMKFALPGNQAQLFTGIRRALKFVFAKFCENPHRPPAPQETEFLKKLFYLLQTLFEEVHRTQGAPVSNKGKEKGGKSLHDGARKRQNFENHGRNQEDRGGNNDDGPEVGSNAWIQMQNQQNKRQRGNNDAGGKWYWDLEKGKAMKILDWDDPKANTDLNLAATTSEERQRRSQHGPQQQQSEAEKRRGGELFPLVWNDTQPPALLEQVHRNMQAVMPHYRVPNRQSELHWYSVCDPIAVTQFNAEVFTRYVAEFIDAAEQIAATDPGLFQQESDEQDLSASALLREVRERFHQAQQAGSLDYLDFRPATLDRLAALLDEAHQVVRQGTGEGQSPPFDLLFSERLALFRAQHCDSYGPGGGMCIMQAHRHEEPHLRDRQKVLLNSNCQIWKPKPNEKQEGGMLSQLFHCPMGAPIALFVLPKSGTSSAMNYIMDLEPYIKTSLGKAMNAMLIRPKVMIDWLAEELD
eukprot:g15909.t1